MATQFSNAFAQYGGVEINIHKRIPVAVAVITLQSGRLDLLWKLGANSSQNCKYWQPNWVQMCPCLEGGDDRYRSGRQLLPSLDHLYVVLKYAA